MKQRYDDKNRMSTIKIVSPGHLFAGGFIKEKPTICQPIKRETVKFGGGQLRH